MTWNIVTDSSCDLPPSQSEDGEIRLSSVPFIISVGNADFVDDEEEETAPAPAQEEHSDEKK